MDYKRFLLPVFVIALLLLVGAGVSGLSAATLRARHVSRKASPRLLAPRKHFLNPRLTRTLRATTWRWQLIVGRHAQCLQDRQMRAAPDGIRESDGAVLEPGDDAMLRCQLVDRIRDGESFVHDRPT